VLLLAGAVVLVLAGPRTITPCMPAARWPGIGQKKVYFPAFVALTFSVAVAPGAMWPVLTVPAGVTTDSACVTAPLFLTVIVIVPVFATVGLAGVILNSVSVSVSRPPLETLWLDVAAAALEDDAGAELVLDDEPQPASTTAVRTNGVRVARRRIWATPILSVAPVLTPPGTHTFPPALIATLKR
jgi:hypothetical protein